MNKQQVATPVSKGTVVSNWSLGKSQAKNKEKSLKDLKASPQIVNKSMKVAEKKQEKIIKNIHDDS